MKSILYTVVSGIFVCLITSIGIQTELENYELPEEVIEQIKISEEDPISNVNGYHSEYDTSNISYNEF